MRQSIRQMRVPNGSHAEREVSMKRRIAILMAGCMLLGITGCGNQLSPSTKKLTKDSETDSSEETEKQNKSAEENPYYYENLRKLTGNDKEIQDFVMGYDMAHIFLDKLEDMIRFLVPNYVLEGKNQLVIAIGCTGGKHRSVTLANKLYERLSDQTDYGIKLEHRDIGKDAARGK